jgi:hypothetical protein
VACTSIRYSGVKIQPSTTRTKHGNGDIASNAIIIYAATLDVRSGWFWRSPLFHNVARCSTLLASPLFSLNSNLVDLQVYNFSIFKVPMICGMYCHFIPFGTLGISPVFTVTVRYANYHLNYQAHAYPRPRFHARGIWGHEQDGHHTVSSEASFSPRKVLQRH